MALKRPLIALALLLAAWPVLPAAHAQDGGVDLFAATVAVDETAETAVAAKNRAIGLAGPAALGVVFERLVLPEDRALLPSVDGESLQAMIRSLSVAEEKTAPGRYLARVTVAFRPDSVRSLLRGNGIGYSESRAPAALVVPVLQRRADLMLFVAENPWLEAWRALDSQDTALTPLLVPLGDLQDLTELEPGRLIDGDRAALLRAAERYGARDALLALAVLQTDEAGAPRRLDVSVTRYPREGEDSLQVESLTPEPDEAMAAFLDRAVGRIVGRLRDDWKAVTRLQVDRQGELLITAEFIDLADWVAMREILRASPVVETAQVDSITLRDAQVRVRYLGDEARLATALARDGLDLAQDQGFWRLVRVRRR